MPSNKKRSFLRYSFRLLGYQLFVFLSGGLAVAIGIGLLKYNAHVSIVVVLSGIAIVSTGILATLYKVIVDAIEVGTRVE